MNGPTYMKKDKTKGKTMIYITRMNHISSCPKKTCSCCSKFKHIVYTITIEGRIVHQRCTKCNLDYVPFDKMSW